MTQDGALLENDVLGFALRPDNVQGELSFIATITVSRLFRK